jgi:hypothetical protein
VSEDTTLKVKFVREEEDSKGRKEKGEGRRKRKEGEGDGTRGQGEGREWIISFFLKNFYRVLLFLNPNLVKGVQWIISFLFFKKEFSVS